MRSTLMKTLRNEEPSNKESFNEDPPMSSPNKPLSKETPRVSPPQ